MSTRMAGSEPMLPQILTAMGLIPANLEAVERARSSLDADQVAIMSLLRRPGFDPRDYKVESGLWRSEILPSGVSIDQAIRDGIWS